MSGGMWYLYLVDRKGGWKGSEKPLYKGKEKINGEKIDLGVDFHSYFCIVVDVGWKKVVKREVGT